MLRIRWDTLDTLQKSNIATWILIGMVFVCLRLSTLPLSPVVGKPAQRQLPHVTPRVLQVELTLIITVTDHCNHCHGNVLKSGSPNNRWMDKFQIPSMDDNYRGTPVEGNHNIYLQSYPPYHPIVIPL